MNKRILRRVGIITLVMVLLFNTMGAQASTKEEPTVIVDNYGALYTEIVGASSGDVIGIKGTITIPAIVKLNMQENKSITLRRMSADAKIIISGDYGADNKASFQMISFDGNATEVGGTEPFVEISGNAYFNMCIFTDCNNENGNGGAVNIVSGEIEFSCSSFEEGSASYGSFIFNAGTLILDSCTLKGGWADEMGGAIYNKGTLTVKNTEIKGSNARIGGGIYNNSSLVVENSLIWSNTATVQGADIANEGSYTNSTTEEQFDSLLNYYNLYYAGWADDTNTSVGGSGEYMKFLTATEKPVKPDPTEPDEPSTPDTPSDGGDQEPTDPQEPDNTEETEPSSPDAPTEPADPQEPTTPDEGEQEATEPQDPTTTPSTPEEDKGGDTDSSNNSGSNSTTTDNSSTTNSSTTDNSSTANNSSTDNSTTNSNTSSDSSGSGNTADNSTNSSSTTTDSSTSSNTTTTDNSNRSTTNNSTTDSSSSTTDSSTHNQSTDSRSYSEDNSYRDNSTTESSTVNNYYQQEASESSTATQNASQPINISVPVSLSTTEQKEADTGTTEATEAVTDTAILQQNIKIEAEGVDLVYEYGEDGVTISIKASKEAESTTPEITTVSTELTASKDTEKPQNSPNWVEVVTMILLAVLVLAEAKEKLQSKG